VTHAAKHHAAHPSNSDSELAPVDTAAPRTREQATAALATLAPGRLIAGKYRLTREIGHGGMGAVWEARHETLERAVAVKFLKPGTNADEARAERFVSEARMVAALEHRFIVDVFDFGVSDEGLYFMVLELLHGRSLAHRLEHGPALGVHEAIGVIADCLRGLHAVHEAGIVHRDLKPDNIILVEDSEGMFPKLIDFGISKRTEHDLLARPAPRDSGVPATGEPLRRSRLTVPGMVIGTLDYMPPEQLRGRDDLDRRADVYSMGVILYEWLAGRVPFDQDNIADLIVAITMAGAPPLSLLRPDLGPELSGVLENALASRPDDRYPTALALREALLATLPSIARDVSTGRMPSAAATGCSDANPQLDAPPATAASRWGDPDPQLDAPPATAPRASDIPRADPVPEDPWPAADEDVVAGGAPARSSRRRSGVVVMALLLTIGVGSYAVLRPSTPSPASLLKPRRESAPQPTAAEVALPKPLAQPLAPPEEPAADDRRPERKTPTAPRARPGRAGKPSPAEASPVAPRSRKIYRELDF
jgi:serine/threonine protein kinase